MENVPEHDLDRLENLATVYALRDRYGLRVASELLPCTEAERHRLAHGHGLAFGCCRVGDPLRPSERDLS